MSELPIYVVSGGLGNSGGQLVRTALAQFEEADNPVIVMREVRSEEQVVEAVTQAAEAGGVIVHTLVDDDIRGRLSDLALQRSVVELDLIGPLLHQLSTFLGQSRLGKPGLYRQLHEEHFRRIEAFEYAVRHDDGKATHELSQAEIVLVGVSRVGKTSLSMYLSMKGWKTANVPLVKGIPPPATIFDVDHRRVVGLVVHPDQLGVYRRARQRSLGMPSNTPYTDPEEHYAEMEYSRQTFRKGKFGIQDITDKPIEESAQEIIARVTRLLES